MQRYSPEPRFTPPASIPVRGASPNKHRKIADALELLREAAPGEYEHFFKAIVAIEVRVGACGDGALACTAGGFGRAAVLSVDPASRSVVDVAVTLAHEARHHGLDCCGRWVVVRHTCVPHCDQPQHRARDPIYRRDATVRRRLLAHLRTMPVRVRPAPVPRRPRPPRPRRPSTSWLPVAVGATVVGLGLVGAVALSGRG